MKDTASTSELVEYFSNVQGYLSRGDASPMIGLVTRASIIGGHPVLDLSALAPSNPDEFGYAASDDRSLAARNEILLGLDQVINHLEHAPSCWRHTFTAEMKVAHGARNDDETAFEDPIEGLNPSLRYALLAIDSPARVLLIAFGMGDQPDWVLRAPSGPSATFIHQGVREQVDRIIDLAVGDPRP